MGFAVRNLATGLIRSWARWEAPAFDSETEEIITADEPPEIAPDPAAVPPLITRWQGRRWLLNAELFTDVESLIAAGGDVARVDYGAATWLRSNPMFETLGAALFPTETSEQVAARIDQMFREAAQLQ